MAGFLIAAALLLVGGLRFLLRGKAQKLVINEPRLGIFDLGAGQQYAATDMARLSPLFAHTISDDSRPPKCDVLFIYAELRLDGTLADGNLRLRNVIRDSEAAVVVLALENPIELYIKAANGMGYGRANLVMTLKRNGASFENFFHSLFSEMKCGVSMPVAWANIAPQNPNAEYDPGLVFDCERGQVTFA